MKPILHYIYDPLCGWCYAAEKLTDAMSSQTSVSFEIQLHAGGLFPRMHLPEAKRSHIRSADARIGDMTGQVFGDAYLNELLGDPNTIYDSAMPIRGILAAEKIEHASGLAMLKALQQAHYQRGLRIVESATMADIAAEIGLDRAQFVAAFDGVTEAELQRHLEDTHRLMRDVGARGFPSFVAQIGSEYRTLPHERFYSQPQGFADLVNSTFASAKTVL